MSVNADCLKKYEIEKLPKTLQADTEITLNDQQFNDFIAHCDNPPLPSKRLQLAAKRLKEDGFGFKEETNE